MMAKLSRISPLCRGRNTTPTPAWRCVSQSVTAVKPISTRAVQRGHKPMIRANGPSTSAATTMAATRAGKGTPLAPSEAAKAGEGQELVEAARQKQSRHEQAAQEQGPILAAAQHQRPPDPTSGPRRL